MARKQADTATEEDGSTDEGKPTKVKLTPEERRVRVQEAREARVRDFFAGKSFDYIGPTEMPAGEMYVDVSGNKGKSGFIIKDQASGEETVIGPTALKKGVETYNAIHGYEKPRRGKKADAEAESEEATVNA